jgi:hypothetical protein
MEVAGAIELHYYLVDRRHSMDAVLRNLCESELLALFHEVSSVLGVPVSIEAQALREGGLKEIWKWIGQNSPQLNLVLAIAAIMIALAPQVHQSGAEKLTEQLTELKIEKTQLEIEKLKKELQQMPAGTEDVVKHNAIHFLKNDPRVVVRRSNFYKHLSTNNTVTGIGIVPYDTSSEPIQPEVAVPRSDFEQFVLTTQTLKPEIVDEAAIELVSPVLREGKFKWKGIYNGKAINFSMHDATFRHQVLREEVTFQHGTVLDCVLEVSRKLDEVGEIEITDYAVKTVIKKYDDAQSIETSQGRAYKDAKRLRESQGEMFDVEDH